MMLRRITSLMIGITCMLSMPTCHAGVIEGDVVILEHTDLQFPAVTHEIVWGRGPRWTFSPADLEVHSSTIGGTEFRLFPAVVGDVITQVNVPDRVGNSFFGNIPFGDSYFGFADRELEPIPSPWIQIGWVQFRRDEVGLEVLSSAYSVNDSPRILLSPGIIVGTLQVPEPKGSVWLTWVPLLALSRRRRLRRLCAGFCQFQTGDRPGRR